MAMQVHYRSSIGPRPYSWSSAFTSELTYSYTWAFFTPFILYLADRFRIVPGRVWKSGSIHFAAACLVAAATKLTWDFTALPSIAPKMVPVDASSAVKSIVASLDFGFPQYLIVLVCHHAIDYYSRYQEGLLRASQLETQLANAQLQALKMQLQPHFLFNTLHAITELVHEDPVAAEGMITKLGDFLRLSIDHAGAVEVTLSQEIDFVKRYLEIEQMRFEDRLRVEYEISPNAINALVPNLILQPLVENSLKYGISQMERNGVLRIMCAVEDGRLRMRVADNGPGLNPMKATNGRQGLGLANTRGRLERMYGGNHKISLENAEEGGFLVTIEIPFRPTTNELA